MIFEWRLRQCYCECVIGYIILRKQVYELLLALCCWVLYCAAEDNSQIIDCWLYSIKIHKKSNLKLLFFSFVAAFLSKKINVYKIKCECRIKFKSLAFAGFGSIYNSRSIFEIMKKPTKCSKKVITFKFCKQRQQRQIVNIFSLC